ncbi:ATP-binding cassette domain-containing protein [Tepidibacillus marianensis]|uniref:ATP-binding cassette domain-containing protein n=1 Tax=Tepidibacillus marianensis TaxID=3131995 RepID=UPI0030D1DF9D
MKDWRDQNAIHSSSKKLSHFHLSMELTIKDEVVVLFGPSGSGKTTLLNMVAGLVNPDLGKMVHDETILFDKNQKINLPPKKRKVGYLFQDFALFPHLTVEKNIQYGNINKRLPSYMDQLIHVLRIKHLMDKYPNQISGGEKQRVALVRALATEPRLLLLDEPFSSLDFQTRMQCHEELLYTVRKWNIPVILVTHDYQEAKKLGDIIHFVDMGKIHNTKIIMPTPLRPASVFATSLSLLVSP